MNLRHNISSLLLLALALSTAACSKPSADENPNPKPGTGGSDPAPVDTEITSIHDLNATQGYLNSHAPEWQSSSLEMDFRSFMKLEKPLLSAVNARYPRIKKLKDNTFLPAGTLGPRCLLRPQQEFHHVAERRRTTLRQDGHEAVRKRCR